MKRATFVLAALLVVQIVLAVFVLYPRTAAGGVAGPLFAKLAATDITTITLYDKPDSSVKLQRQGDKWVLADADGFPADSAKINAMLNKLVGIRTDRLVARTPNSQARLKVAANDYVGRIDFQTSDGQNRTLYVGSSPGARSNHVRAGDQNEIYLADFSNADASGQPGSWIDTTYLPLAAPDVTGLTLKNGNGEFVFSRDGSNNWSMSGLGAAEKLSAEAIDSFVNQLVAMRISRPLGKTEKPDYGLAKPAAELTIKTKKDNQDKTVVLQVGSSKDAGNTYVVKSSDSPYYVRVAEFSVKDLIEKKREGFLQAPPSPTPAPTPALQVPGTPTPGQ